MMIRQHEESYLTLYFRHLLQLLVCFLTLSTFLADLRISHACRNTLIALQIDSRLYICSGEP